MTREEFEQVIITNHKQGKNIVIVNIGTEKVIGDSFGPLLGSMLKDKLNVIKIYGTLDETINALNLKERLADIKKKHENDLIIGVDCGLSSSNSNCNNDFILCNDSFVPGKGVRESSEEELGDLSILFCIKNDKINSMDSLRNRTIKEIYNRTRKAAEFIFDIDEKLYEAEKLWEELQK